MTKITNFDEQSRSLADNAARSALLSSMEGLWPQLTERAQAKALKIAEAHGATHWREMNVDGLALLNALFSRTVAKAGSQ